MLEKLIEPVLVEVIPERFKNQKTKNLITCGYSYLRILCKTGLGVLPIAIRIQQPEIYTNHKYLIPIAAILIADMFYSAYNYVKHKRNTKAHVLVELIDVLYFQKKKQLW